MTASVQSCQTQNSEHDCTSFRCREPFIIILPSSRYDLNNVERDVKHQIIKSSISGEVLSELVKCEPGQRREFLARGHHVSPIMSVCQMSVITKGKNQDKMKTIDSFKLQESTRLHCLCFFVGFYRVCWMLAQMCNDLVWCWVLYMVLGSDP